MIDILNNIFRKYIVYINLIHIYLNYFTHFNYIKIIYMMWKIYLDTILDYIILYYIHLESNMHFMAN